jgi:hypothetical protein
LIWPSREEESFRSNYWTGVFGLKSFSKLVFWRDASEALRGVWWEQVKRVLIDQLSNVKTALTSRDQ